MWGQTSSEGIAAARILAPKLHGHCRGAVQGSRGAAIWLAWLLAAQPSGWGPWHVWCHCQRPTHLLLTAAPLQHAINLFIYSIIINIMAQPCCGTALSVMFQSGEHFERGDTDLITHARRNSKAILVPWGAKHDLEQIAAAFLSLVRHGVS